MNGDTNHPQSLAVIEAQELEKELVRVYEQRHQPLSVAASKGSVTDSTWLNWQPTPSRLLFKIR